MGNVLQVGGLGLMPLGVVGFRSSTTISNSVLII
uniref:Uncharacterized protein n=1 Tax=Setaria italica TaxID=4555 RepID=K3ZG28_SETIT